MVVFDVEPAGVGDILVNGVVAGPYPEEIELFDGEHDISASADMWWVFTHWSHENNAILPDLESPDATLVVDTGGSVVAHFEYVEHVNLEVDVVPAGAGTVDVVGRAIVSDHWEDSFVVDGPQAFIAKPAGDWKFDHWEVTGAEDVVGLQTDALSVVLPADGDVRVVAHFTELDLRLFVPNAFSPNNDGLNDGFRPLGQAFGATDYHFQIFNRWGKSSSPRPIRKSTGSARTNAVVSTTCETANTLGRDGPLDARQVPEDFSGMLTVVR